MMSLFSSFDFLIFYYSFFVLLIFSSLIFQKFYLINSVDLMMYISTALGSFFYSLKPLMFNKMTLLLILGSFFSIMTMNVFSIFPFIFPFTSQFGPMILLSLSIWISFMVFSFVKNTSGVLSHFIPEGSPLPLTFFLFMIELISNSIRPITLTVRLVANILAGHLLMILLSQMVLSAFIFFPLYMILNTVEIFVAIIQSYIFCTMLVLYFSEIH